MNVYFSEPNGDMKLIYEGATVTEIDTLFEDFKLGVWVGGTICEDHERWRLNYGIGDDYNLYAVFEIAD